MTNYNDGKWHPWNGGGCPVRPESEVITCHLATGSPVTNANQDFASDQMWENVIAFRVVKEHKEPREFWVDAERCIAVPSYHAGFIHVREVIE